MQPRLKIMTRKLPHQIILIAAYLLLSLLTARTVDATVTISSTGKRYRSRPASFGLEFEDDLEYAALLQVVEDDLYLCAGNGENVKDGPVSNGDGQLEDGVSGNDDTNPAVREQMNINVIPSDEVPVAILAKRGQCSYETKARVAQSLTSPHGAVRFLIVYNDDESEGQQLIVMSPETRGDNKWDEVGLVFVSHKSGVDLHEYVTGQSREVTSNGGPRVLIDGSYRRAYARPTRKTLAGLTSLIMLIGGFLSLMLQLIFRTPSVRRLTGNHSRQENGPRLLTREEVETLPVVEYSGILDGSRSSDKSQQPPTAEDGAEGESSGPCAGVASPIVDKEKQRKGSGLCVALFREEKDHDMNICQDTCSICLEEYEQGECIRVLPCGHTFHSSCIFPWLTERSPTCPMCKAHFQVIPCKEDEEDVVSPSLPPMEEELPAHNGRPHRNQQQEPLELERGERQPAEAAPALTVDDEESSSAEATPAPTVDDEESSSRLSFFGRRLLRRLFDTGGSSAAAPAQGDILDEPLLRVGSDLGGDSVEMV